MTIKDFNPRHFNRRMAGDVAVITSNRPERKNLVTLNSYAELGETFRCASDLQKFIIARADLSEISGAAA